MSIEVRNITKAFDDFKALNNVSLNVDDGELVALLGPSGCGKTTLLRMIAGLDFVDEGEVWLNGENVTGKHIKQRGVGFVFQHYALFGHMTVFENVAFGLRVLKRSERPSEDQIRKRVHELLDLVQLDWLSKRFPAQLSGGQRQRVALARALAVEPKFLLLDEPFGALDANVRKELRRWLRRLHDELHVTSIFVTHDQEEAMEVASRIVVMDKGRIEQVGTPEAVYDRPASPFVSSFIGNVNVFHGRLQGGSLDTGGWQLPIRPPGSDDVGDDTPYAAYIRPHDFELLKSTEEKLPECRVKFIQPMGSVYRLEVVPEHAASDGLPEVIDVELPRRDFRALNLSVGERVYLRATETHWFEAGQPAVTGPR